MPRIGEIIRGRKIGKDGHRYIWLPCSDCGKEKWVRLDIAKGGIISIKCKSCGMKNRNQGSDNHNWKGGICKDIKRYYAQYYKIHQEKILKYKKKYREEKVFPYRGIIQKKIGRELKKGERVHHVDMVHSHNDLENLFVYENISQHQVGHASLYKLVYGLLRDNIIEFRDGRYYRV